VCAQISDVQEAEFPSDCHCLDQLITIMSDIAMAVFKWNGFGCFKKTLSICLASKYEELFSLKFALLDRVEKDLMKAAIANTFEGIEQVQDKLASFTYSNERARSLAVIMQRQVCMCPM
jgi:hypothetical protein